MNVVNIEARTFEAMMSRFESFAERVESLCRENGEKTMREWLDNEAVCRTFDLSKRTLQTHRDNGTLPHTRIGNKMYYKAEDLQRFVKRMDDKQRYHNKPKLKTA